MLTCLSPFQNGYPSRRRSLVDDARFESAVVKQTKQAVLDEARLKANGECQCQFQAFCSRTGCWDNFLVFRND